MTINILRKGEEVISIETPKPTPMIINEMISKLRSTVDSEYDVSFQGIFFGNVCYNIAVDKGIELGVIDKQEAERFQFRQEIPIEVFEHYFPGYQKC